MGKCLKIFSSKTALLIGTKLRWEWFLGGPPFRIVSDDPAGQPTLPTSADIVLTWDPMGTCLKIFSFEAAEANLGQTFIEWSLGNVPFQNYIR